MDLRIDLIVCTQSGLAISGGREVLPGVDRGIVRGERREAHLIPGSSLRGRTRAALEALAAAAGLVVCGAPRAGEMCMPVADEFCVACRLFGSPWRRSPLSFSDLWSQPTGQVARAEVRPGVGLDRYTGTAAEDRLYWMEAVPHGWVFSGTIRGDLAEEEIPWLLAALGHVRHLGGGKSRGLGKVEIRVDALRVGGEVADPASWRARLALAGGGERGRVAG